MAKIPRRWGCIPHPPLDPPLFKKTSLSSNISDTPWSAQVSHFPRTRVLQVLNWLVRTEHVQTLAVELHIPSSGTVLTGES